MKKITVEPKLTAKSDGTKFPDLIDQGGNDAFYNEEIKVADELFKFGEIEGGIHYLGSAVVVEVHPWRLLQSLHEHFSEGAFH